MSLNGIVIMWSGNSSTVPAGWFVCNGSNGTPDLRNRFVVGSGSTFAFNSTGGFANTIVPSHNHTSSAPAAGGNHGHSITRGGSTTGYQGSPTMIGNVTNQQNANYPFKPTTSTASIPNHNHTGGAVNNAGVSPTNKNLPPYYSLFYIMKGGS